MCISSYLKKSFRSEFFQKLFSINSRQFSFFVSGFKLTCKRAHLGGVIQKILNQEKYALLYLILEFECVKKIKLGEF